MFIQCRVKRQIGFFFCFCFFGHPRHQAPFKDLAIVKYIYCYCFFSFVLLNGSNPIVEVLVLKKHRFPRKATVYIVKSDPGPYSRFLSFPALPCYDIINMPNFKLHPFNSGVG